MCVLSHTVKALHLFRCSKHCLVVKTILNKQIIRNEIKTNNNPWQFLRYKRVSNWRPFLVNKADNAEVLTPAPVLIDQVSPIRGTRSSTWSTGGAYTRLFRYPHRKKRRGLSSGDLAGHGTGPRWPIHLSPNVAVSCCLARWLKCAVAPSFLNYSMSLCVLQAAPLPITLAGCLQKIPCNLHLLSDLARHVDRVVCCE